MLFTEQDILDHLRAAIHAIGSQKLFAQHYHISQQYLSDVLRGRREPGQKILDALGYERIVFYRPLSVATNVAESPQNTHHSAS